MAEEQKVVGYQYLGYCESCDEHRTQNFLHDSDFICSNIYPKEVFLGHVPILFLIWGRSNFYNR
jgi:hypothetical protein